MEKQTFQTSKALLQKAIETLEVFIKQKDSLINFEDGGLVASSEKKTRLQKIISLACCYIGPLFSEHLRKEREKRLRDLKTAVLHARDVISSFSPLIEKFKEGDESQKKFAECAMLTIERYNSIVRSDSPLPYPSNFYNYEQQRLLSDCEIKGQEIELPKTSIKYHSDPIPHPDKMNLAYRTLGNLSRTFHKGAAKKRPSSLATQKNTEQWLIDMFHIKVHRLISTHLGKSPDEIVRLIKKASLEIDDETAPGFIQMQQLIQGDDGSIILVTGSFQRNQSHQSHFMPMPIPDSFKLSFELTHTGFPYPSQHTGWTLGDEWVSAAPLRSDQTPVFQKIDKRRKRLAHRLLFDQPFNAHVRAHFKLKRSIFDQNRDLFLPLHRRLQETIMKEFGREEASVHLDPFYEEAANASSSFDFLTEVHQQLVDIFIHQPMKALKEEWLVGESSVLSAGSCEEKFHAARLNLEQHHERAMKECDLSDLRQLHIVEQGPLLSQAFRSVGLQYQSEKMGFSPPLLNRFERKLQACAFQQLIAFLNECEERLDILDPVQIKSELLLAFSRDLQLIEAGNEHADLSSFEIVNELQYYFNSRFERAQKK
ncbi:MAG: hypothetical protein ACH350_09370 [Parachlamydiaceae bacterium]